MITPKVLQVRPEFHPLSIARMLWKGKLWIAVVWAIVSIGAIGYVRRLPSLYYSDALIVVDLAKVPERFVSSTVPYDQERIARITQEVQTSAKLQQIIEEVGLYTNVRGRMVPEDLVQLMRRSIKVTISGPGMPANSFRVGFEGSDPAQVAQAANRLANVYIEENLKRRESQAEGTTEFVDAQLQEAKKKLDDLEAAIGRYKLQHMGELPQQETALAAILGRLQADSQANANALDRARSSKEMIESSLSMLEASLITGAEPPQIITAAQEPPPPPAPKRAPKESDLLEEQLKALRMRYTEQHPEIRHMTQRLARARAFERERPDQEPALAQAASPAHENLKVTQPAAAPEHPRVSVARDRISALQAQIALLDKEIASRNAEAERIRGEMASFQRRLQHIPLREQEMAQITRDYEISKDNYTSLLGKKLSAEMATDLEKRQKSERFTILETARVPRAPYKPNRLALAFMGSAAGLVCGIAVAVGLELKKNVLLGEWELPETCPLLGSLPRIDLMKVAEERPAGR